MTKKETVIRDSTSIKGSVEYGSFSEYTFIWANSSANMLAITLSEVSPSDSPIRLSVIDSTPYTQTTFSGYLSLYLVDGKISNRIRVSWSNENQVTAASGATFNKTNFNTGMIGKTASFVISVKSSLQTTNPTSSYSFDLMDAVVILLILSTVVLLTSTASYFVNRARRRRLNAMQELLPLPPPPEMFCYKIEFDNSNTQNQLPISIEYFNIGKTSFQATSFIILMPGTNHYIQNGDLPKFGVGTRFNRPHK